MRSVFLLLVFGLIGSPGRVINFDAHAVGKLPPGWSVNAGDGVAPRWEVLRDRTAPTQPYVFAQLAAESAGGSSALAIFGSASLRDGDVSVRVKPVSGNHDRTGGVVFRYRDPKNYYLARADAKRQRVGLFKVKDGRPTLLASVQHDYPPNAWSILKVAVGGNRIQIYVDHRRVLKTEDGTFASAGGVGLWSARDSVVYFDDFRVNPK